MGGEPTLDKLGLPLPSYMQTVLEMMSNTMTRQERELKRLRGLDFGKREGTFYLMLIQKAQMAGGQFLTTGEPLALNTKGKQNMARW